MRCRHRLSKLLLRHGIRFDDGDAWTDRHRAWLDGVELEWPAAQATLLDVRGAIDALTHRRDGLERQIVSMLPSSPWRSQVGVLRCLRGVDTLTAVGLCAEVGDVTRFGRAEQLMSYLGLVPCESTTGQQRRLGSITKTGSAHARRLLVEAAWQYRPRPNLSKTPDRTPSRSAPGSCRGRVDGAEATAPHPGRASKPAGNAGRSSRSQPPASSPDSAGRSPKSNDLNIEQSPHYPVGWVGGGPARAGNPRASCEQPAPPAGHARS